MFKRVLAITFGLLIFINSAAFAHTALVDNSGANKYKSVRLTPEIYNNANSDLSDILVKNQAGENIPFFINTSDQISTHDTVDYPLALINSYTKDEAFCFDYKVKNLPSDRDIISTSLELVTAETNFAKSIGVLGSYDNLNWEKIQDDSIYSVDSKKKLTVNFIKPQKFTYIRLKLANNLEKIAFDEAKLVYNVSTYEESYFIEDLKPQFQVENKDNRTYIRLKGLKNIKLAEITVLSSSMFKRMLRTPWGGKEIFNLTFNGISYVDTTIPLNRKISADDTLELTIENNDDQPISIDGITVKYCADELVFSGEASSSFQICFAKDDSKKAPKYDISSYKQEILKDKIDKLTIKNIEFDTPQETKKSDYKIYFNIIVVITAVLLAGIILHKLKKR